MNDSNQTVLAIERCNLARQEIQMILKSHRVSLDVGVSGEISTKHIFKNEDRDNLFAHSDKSIENVQF